MNSSPKNIEPKIQSPEPASPPPAASPPSFIDKIIRFCLEQKLVVALIVAFIVILGIIVAPFDWEIKWLNRMPISVDAIPDIGEKQQIVFTEWEGRSPKDVDDQVSYPLTVSLFGIPGVKTIRSNSQLGFSFIYIIFDENVPFEATQNRVIARLNGLPAGTLPEGVKPAIGPYATALGQVFWYTLEGRDPDGNPAGGWSPDELRTLQDWTVRYHIQSANGIAEAASMGGFVQEYQIDVDPDAMRAHNVSLNDIFESVRNSNLDVGARQIELNGVEYLIRARGFIKTISDIEDTVVKENENVPIYVKNVAKVSFGPAYRDGALDKEGTEAVGGVVVVRHGYNPLAAIKNAKAKIAEISSTLPVKALADYNLTNKKTLEEFAAREGFEAYSGIKLNNDKWIEWLNSHPRANWPAGITVSRVTIVPFYDRTNLIYETLGTLNSALYQQVLITTIVMMIMASHLRSSILVSAVMPLSVLISFIMMKIFAINANIVSLSGIAIAIGTIVDMGIVIADNILQHLGKAPPDEPPLETIYRATSEVGGAIFTAIATTVVGFLPVFLMTGPEGRLFIPLAFTKTFCLLASVVVALTIIPAAAQILLTGKFSSKRLKNSFLAILIFTGLAALFFFQWFFVGIVMILAGIYWLFEDKFSEKVRVNFSRAVNIIAIFAVVFFLAKDWMPLGVGKGLLPNFLFTGGIVGAFLGFYYIVEKAYEPMMGFFLRRKLVFLCIPFFIALSGYTAWLGFPKLFGWIPDAAAKSGIPREYVIENNVWSTAVHKFPGFGREFMPPLDEGSYLYMPTTMPHASIGEALDILQKQDTALRAIPEIESVVGKIGRAETALDPAPVNMIETVINYKSEYLSDKNGRIMRLKYDEIKKNYPRENGDLIPDKNGRPFRQWRDHIKTPDDIWKEIVKAAEIPGTTSAPKLQPIAARIVMLQSGMRAPMGVKIKGQNLEDVEQAGLLIERALKDVPSVEADAVVADRIIGKPYLEIDIDRKSIARYGLKIKDVQDVIETAIGGVRLTTTVEGRKRFPVRVRYMRELRDTIETMGKIYVPSMTGESQIPLSQLAEIKYVRGPEMIKSEDSFLVGYVLFDKKAGFAETDVVEECQRLLQDRIESGELILPEGASYKFAGNYENQIHAQKTLALILPLTFFVIFMIIYFQFRSIVITTIVFITIFVCWGGGLTLIWLYGQDWFMNFSAFGIDFRELFRIREINMSIAVWVGFLALFGIASDDAVLVCTYLEQRFAETKPETICEIRKAVIFAGKRRVKACLMTTATTVVALLPVLTSYGRGADIMAPMSIPSFGGMLAEVFVMFIAAVLYCWYKERTIPKKIQSAIWLAKS
jgi:Cu(I)/Ag(I) efflux system membrane protein CusA/SilA